GVAGFNLVDWGKVDEGLAQYEMSLEEARRAGNRRREAWSLGLGSWGLLAASRPQDADRWLTQCLVLVDDLRWTSFRPWPVALLVELLIDDARLSSKLGLHARAGTCKREAVSLAARSHMDVHVERAARLS